MYKETSFMSQCAATCKLSSTRLETAQSLLISFSSYCLEKNWVKIKLIVPSQKVSFTCRFSFANQFKFQSSCITAVELVGPRLHEILLLVEVVWFMAIFRVFSLTGRQELKKIYLHWKLDRFIMMWKLCRLEWGFIFVIFMLSSSLPKNSYLCTRVYV